MSVRKLELICSFVSQNPQDSDLDASDLFRERGDESYMSGSKTWIAYLAGADTTVAACGRRKSTTSPRSASPADP